MKKELPYPEDPLFLIISCILFFCVLFEAMILGFAFFGADEVNCNLLWCEFKTSFSDGEINSISKHYKSYSQTSECFLNNVKINCSDIDSPFNLSKNLK